jgi:hypothetical protein
MLDQRQIFVSDAPVPRVSVLSLSVVAHIAVLVLIVLRHATAPQIVPTKYEMVQAVSGTDQVTYNPPPKTNRPATARTIAHGPGNAQSAAQSGAAALQSVSCAAQ